MADEIETKPIVVVGVDNEGIVYGQGGDVFSPETMTDFSTQMKFNLDRLGFPAYRDFVRRYFHTANTLVVSDKTE